MGRAVPVSRANSPSWGVSTVRALRPSSISICPARAFMPSASSTTGISKSSSSARTSFSVLGALPRPGPMRAASQERAFSRISPYRSGRGKGMAEEHFTATMG